MGFGAGPLLARLPGPGPARSFTGGKGSLMTPFLTPETVGDLLRFAVVEHGGDVQAGALGTSMHVPL